MTMRQTLLIQFGRQAWSETHYDLTSTQIGPQSEVRANILATKRAALLGMDAAVFACRTSDPTNPGNSELLRFNPAIAGPKFTINVGFLTSITVDNAGIANEAVMVDAGGVVGARFHHARIMLGAPPTGLIQSAAGVPVVQVAQCPQYQTNFNTLAAELTNGTWGFRVRNEGAAFPVQQVLGGNGNPILLVVDNAFTPPAQTLVHVRGFRVHPTTRRSLAGIWRTLAPVAGPLPGTNSIGLSNSESMPAGSSYLLPGTLQTTAALIIQYTDFTVGTGVTRKRGGLIDLPRGRSRTRA
jgi:hypothetical protein